MKTTAILESISIVFFYIVMCWATIYFFMQVFNGGVEGWYRLLWFPYIAWGLANLLAIGILVVWLSGKCVEKVTK